jgi:hypothetical protein
MRWTRYFVAQTAIGTGLNDAQGEAGLFRDFVVVSQLRSAFIDSVSSSSALVDELIEQKIEKCQRYHTKSGRRTRVVRYGFTAFNVYDFVEGASFYHYDGGLTTPPCSEVIWWNIASTPMKISVSQHEQLSYLTLNYRSADTCRPATIASVVLPCPRLPQCRHLPSRDYCLSFWQHIVSCSGHERPQSRQDLSRHGLVFGLYLTVLPGRFVAPGSCCS